MTGGDATAPTSSRPGSWSEPGSAPAPPARSPATPSLSPTTPPGRARRSGTAAASSLPTSPRPKLRHRWHPGAGAGPSPDRQLTWAERNAIWEHAARTAAKATAQIRHPRATDPAATADAAWAAADTALGGRVIRQAADSYDRAARAPHGRIPRPTPTGNQLRHTARLLSAPRHGHQRPHSHGDRAHPPPRRPSRNHRRPPPAPATRRPSRSGKNSSRTAARSREPQHSPTNS